MKLGFKDDSFAFEFLRNLGFTYYGGADIGEMFATASLIREGDLESWFQQWNKRARRTLTRADANLAGGHAVSAREAYLRASTYFRMAAFYLHVSPTDPRITTTSQASEQAYLRAAELTGPTWERVEIPYGGTTLPGYFYKVDASEEPRPTVVFHGGYDSSLEELFFFGAAGAVRRGYNCLTFDGPGQGRPAREQQLVFRHDWEQVVGPVVDYALTRPDVDGGKLALIGMSLGGHLAARTVAFEQRFRGAVFFDGLYDFYSILQRLFPKEAISAYERGDDQACEKITAEAMEHGTNLRWLVTQGLWCFGVRTIRDYLDKARLMTMDGIAGLIQCPCLVLEGAGDRFEPGQPQKIYDAITSPKELFVFTAEDGAEEHCQSGAVSYKDEVVFNWLDDTLGLSAALQS